MSYPVCDLGCMKNKELAFRVKLSPQFEEMAEDWGAEKCLKMARYFANLARQLELRGKIAISDRGRRPRHPMRPLCVRKLARN